MRVDTDSLRNWLERDALRAENARLHQRVRDQDEELQAHAERGHRQLMGAPNQHKGTL